MRTHAAGCQVQSYLARCSHNPYQTRFFDVSYEAALCSIVSSRLHPFCAMPQDAMRSPDLFVKHLSKYAEENRDSGPSTTTARTACWPSKTLVKDGHCPNGASRTLPVLWCPESLQYHMLSCSAEKTPQSQPSPPPILIGSRMDAMRDSTSSKH